MRRRAFALACSGLLREATRSGAAPSVGGRAQAHPALGRRAAARGREGRGSPRSGAFGAACRTGQLRGMFTDAASGYAHFDGRGPYWTAERRSVADGALGVARGGVRAGAVWLPLRLERKLER